MMDTQDRSVLDEVFRKSVLEPLGKYVATFPEYTEAIKKRHKKLLDYDRARASVRSLSDKPAADSTKLPKVSRSYFLL